MCVCGRRSHSGTWYLKIGPKRADEVYIWRWMFSLDASLLHWNGLGFRRRARAKARALEPVPNMSLSRDSCPSSCPPPIRRDILGHMSPLMSPPSRPSGNDGEGHKGTYVPPYVPPPTRGTYSSRDICPHRLNTSRTSNCACAHSVGVACCTCHVGAKVSECSGYVALAARRAYCCVDSRPL